MRRFRFKLESVLRHASRQEQRHTLDLARLQELQRQVQARLARLRETQAARRQALLRCALGAVNLDEIQARRRHLEHLRHRIGEETAALAAAADRVAAKIVEVTEAMKKRKVLERLREREAQEHYLQLSRVEAKILDDLTTPRHTGRALSRSASP